MINETTPESANFITMEIEAEIRKTKKRLDIAYSEVEDMKRQKTTAENDVSQLEKHIKYLEGIKTSKDEEISTKQKVIDSLDIQITNKGVEFDSLQGKISESTVLLSAKNAEYASFVDKMKDHESRMISENESLSKSQSHATEKHRTADEKLEVIRKFISAVNDIK